MGEKKKERYWQDAGGSKGVRGLDREVLLFPAGRGGAKVTAHVGDELGFWSHTDMSAHSSFALF